MNKFIIASIIAAFAIVGTQADTRPVTVINGCGWGLNVHIGNGDSGHWMPSGATVYGTVGFSDRVWADQHGVADAHTLAEFNVNGDGYGTDWYDISLVDGFTYPIGIYPQGGSGDCAGLTCNNWAIKTECPENLRQYDNSEMVACRNHGGNPPFFKARCPQAYSFDYDDASSLHTCNRPASYKIVFCP